MSYLSSLLIYKSIWVIRAGRNGEAHNFFMNHSMIVLSDAEMGDLSKLDHTRDIFYKTYREKHPRDTRTGSAGIAGKYFRFVHNVQIGDLVLYPALKSKLIYIGRVKGLYVYDESVDSDFPHHRSVRWELTIPKSILSETATRELGAARTFFKYKTHHDEIRQLITDGHGKKISDKIDP